MVAGKEVSCLCAEYNLQSVTKDVFNTENHDELSIMTQTTFCTRFDRCKFIYNNQKMGNPFDEETVDFLALDTKGRCK